ncbi:uncharacterized protein LOC116195550 [Punica granatum]|uniref:Uncharacterized protein LOC116195550 n=1 Tax=Punica granatum TaxID=22663 RepID=A0A6P8CGR9_PUNGR|nr:uncharacterized protein LOC116195550 [Punica granatum]XP_031380674.1 uncharacterized protein LOC116195550 [Punica granatum]XP_031380683.1 uncharacterized protein LOC116195550 [Punica granatum]
MGIVTELVTKLFSITRLICLFCVKTTLIVISTWVELIQAGTSLNISVFGKVVLWTFALITLPIRVLTAVRRERQLEAYLKYTQVELEYLLCYQKELEARLEKAIKECKVMEILLSELEEDHETAISRLELLEDELQALKAKNLQLRETRDKESCNFKSQPNQRKPQTTNTTPNFCDIPYGISSLKAPRDGACGQSLQDLLDSEKKNADALLNLLANSNPDQFESLIGLESERSRVLDQQREVALQRSLFSAILSFLVGMIVWEAKDPCMPLVMALFTVVGMSLKSVVQFFSTIKNKPASDAVALLSLNWFILGMLTYPTLPKVARMLTPERLSMLNQKVRWFGT